MVCPRLVPPHLVPFSSSPRLVPPPFSSLDVESAVQQPLWQLGLERGSGKGQIGFEMRFPRRRQGCAGEIRKRGRQVAQPNLG